MKDEFQTPSPRNDELTCEPDSESCTAGAHDSQHYTDGSAQVKGDHSHESAQQVSNHKDGSHSLEVEMNGEKYHLTTLPSPESKAVVAGRRRLLGSVDLVALLNDFGRLASFIRVAYNGVGAAGPKFTEIQIKVQDIGYSITKLFDSSALTIARFEVASETVLNDLQSTYDYLLSNLEELAFETLSSVSKIAQDMVKAANNLLDHAKREEAKVKSTLEQTQKAKGDQALLMQEKAKERKEFQLRAEQQEKVLKEMEQKVIEAEEMIQEYEAKEEDALDVGFWGGLVNAVTTITRGVKVVDKTEKVEHWKRKIEETKAKQQEYVKQRYAAMDKMTEFAIKIKGCNTEEEMAEVAENALHEATGALKHITSVLMQIVQFWEQVKQHCEGLAKDDILRPVQYAIDHYSDDKRLKVWTSNGFKRKAIYFYAQWVALKEVSREYMEHIQLTQKELYKYITENPSYEECRRNLPQIASDFLKDLERDKKALADRKL